VSDEQKQAQQEPEAPKTPAIVTELVEKFGVADEGFFRGDATVRVPVDKLISVFAYLKRERQPAFSMLMDVTAIDLLGKREPRFDVVYHFLSILTRERIRIKAAVAEGKQVPSATPFWNSANWAERETYDMYGIEFRGHPYMKRLLMWEGFDGWPLRKDFPLKGKVPPAEKYAANDQSRLRRL
jgi:NADH-quinone oxidoreductase subunit C